MTYLGCEVYVIIEFTRRSETVQVPTRISIGREAPLGCEMESHDDVKHLRRQKN